MNDLFDYEPYFDNEPYEVTCARCGKHISCEDANLEEGDEWECWPCADRCNEKEAVDAFNHRRRSDRVQVWIRCGDSYVPLGNGGSGDGGNS